MSEAYTGDENVAALGAAIGPDGVANTPPPITDGLPTPSTH